VHRCVRAEFGDRSKRLPTVVQGANGSGTGGHEALYGPHDSGERIDTALEEPSDLGATAFEIACP
jgi:hypothetical protein